MSARRGNKLSSLFGSIIKATSSPALKAQSEHVASSSPATCSIKFRKAKAHSGNTVAKLSDTFKGQASPSSEDSADDLTQTISTLLCEGTSSSTASLHESSSVNTLKNPWIQSLSRNNAALHQKEISRDRNQKWVRKGSFTRRVDRVIKMSAQKLGTDAIVKLIGKFGRETSIKEYNALIGHCIEKSKSAKSEEVTLKQIYTARQLFKSMREQGFQIEEETYGQFLTFLINMGMVDEFKFFCEIIRQENPNSLPRLVYYEMLLWVRLEDEDKIKELCDLVTANEDVDNSSLRENLFLALCESDRSEEMLMLMDIIDITKISSITHLATIFRSLGRLLLEPITKNFFSALKSSDTGAENISKLIYDYAVSMPNLVVEDSILKFKSLHEECGVVPASASYQKLIEHCCNLLKVHAALDIIDHMFEVGLWVSLASFHLILQKCDESCDYNLVDRIYSIIRHNNVDPNFETFRMMINLSVRMNDFEGAYKMIQDMEKMNLQPKATIYNAIMAARFREKNKQAGLQVIKEMESTLVEPDSHTFSYLIANCDCEEDIIKHYEKAKLSGVKLTKQVFMALINAYASCGQSEKAKQVVSEKGIQVKDINEVKSVLVSALACHGHVSDALDIYEEMKEAKSNPNPKTILCLIENFQSKEQSSKLLELLKDINDTDHWIDGCCRVILYCVQYKDLRSTVDLLKQLKDKFCDDDIATEILFNEAFCKIAEMKQPDLQFGMDLVQSIKEELDIRPSRQSLDFLLHICISAKDLKNAHLIWKEYEKAGLVYNALSYLRMYQVLLACGDHKSASETRKKISLGDSEVRCVIKASKTAFSKFEKKKKKKKETIL